MPTGTHIYKAATARRDRRTGSADASDVWRLADGEHSLDDIVNLLAGAYEEPAERIHGDVTATVQDLIDRKLVPPTANLRL
jgi:hypothetical protein